MLGLRCCVGFSPVAVNGGYSPLSSWGVQASYCSGFSYYGALALGCVSFSACEAWSLQFWLSCSMAHGIFPDHGSNPCLLHWQADSLPPSQQGNPKCDFGDFECWCMLCLCLTNLYWSWFGMILAWFFLKNSYYFIVKVLLFKYGEAAPDLIWGLVADSSSPSCWGP